MQAFNAYHLIIAFSVIIILSYLYNVIAKATNIPSVLLLILTGIGLQYATSYFDIAVFDLFPVLEVLGIVGLIMIVLEAALDLELRKDKAKLIVRSFAVAFLGFGFTVFFLALVINYFVDTAFGTALLYATPLSIISSAIVIPSVSNLSKEKNEFMVYESTFSDILGIIFFYFLIEELQPAATGNFAIKVLGNVSFSIAIAFVISYLLILLFQRMQTKVKLFLLIAVLVMLYSISKLLHLSSLLIILVFGLVLNNHEIFFRGFLTRWIKPGIFHQIQNDFKLVTLETAFVIRTFFFIIFGFTISLESLYSVEVFIVSGIMILFIYLLRYGILRSILGREIKTLLYIAPRGLITILLFFAIPVEFQSRFFDSGILLYVILASALFMTYSLINDKSESKKAQKAVANIPLDAHEEEDGDEPYSEKG